MKGLRALESERVMEASFRSGSRTGYNLNNDFRLSNRYTWIDPETGLNLSSSSTDEEQI